MRLTSLTLTFTTSALASGTAYELVSQTNTQDPSPLASKLVIEDADCEKGISLTWTDERGAYTEKYCPGSKEQNTVKKDYDSVCVGYKLDLIDQYACVGIKKKVPFTNHEESSLQGSTYVQREYTVQKKKTTFSFETKISFSENDSVVTIERAAVRRADGPELKASATYKKVN